MFWLFWDITRQRYRRKRSGGKDKKGINSFSFQKKRKRGFLSSTDRGIDIGRKRRKVVSSAKRESMDTMDCISNLPAHIIHHIISYLRTPDAARTCILSKTWKQVWESFPTLEFDQRFFQAQEEKHDGLFKQLTKQNKEKFKNFMENSLQRKRGRNLCLKKLKLHVISFDAELSLLFDRAIDVAIGSNVEELDIHVQGGKRICYCLPQAVLASTTITQLSLYGCKLEIGDDVQLPYLRKLSLKKLHMDAKKFQKLILGCPLVEDLRVITCGGLASLEVSTLSKLDRVDVHLCHGLKKVDILVTDLQTFWYHGKKSKPCEINLSACKILKRLTLEDPNMTDELFQSQISSFPQLEQLVLSKCNSLERVTIIKEKLKSLAFRGCKNLVDADIIAPNLLSFEYDGKGMPFSSLDPSSLREAKLSFESVTKVGHGFCFSDDLLKNLREFLQKFNHSRGLKLVFRDGKIVAVFEAWKKIVLPTINNIKLEIVKSSMTSEDLVECLLRTHHPENLHIVASPNSKVHKLAQAKIMNRQEEPGCCRYYSKKCWRHYLIDAKMENFVDAKLDHLNTGDERASLWNTWLQCTATIVNPITSFGFNWKPV